MAKNIDMTAMHILMALLRDEMTAEDMGRFRAAPNSTTTAARAQQIVDRVQRRLDAILESDRHEADARG